VSEITAVAQTEAGPGRDASDGRLWKSLGYDFFALEDKMRASVSKPPRLPYRRDYPHEGGVAVGSAVQQQRGRVQGREAARATEARVIRSEGPSGRSRKSSRATYRYLRCLFFGSSSSEARLMASRSSSVRPK
jgi:hypothetical protein